MRTAADPARPLGRKRCQPVKIETYYLLISITWPNVRTRTGDRARGQPRTKPRSRSRKAAGAVAAIARPPRAAAARAAAIRSASSLSSAGDEDAGPAGEMRGGVALVVVAVLAETGLPRQEHDRLAALAGGEQRAHPGMGDDDLGRAPAPRRSPRDRACVPAHVRRLEAAVADLRQEHPRADAPPPRRPSPGSAGRTAARRRR